MNRTPTARGRPPKTRPAVSIGSAYRPRFRSGSKQMQPLPVQIRAAVSRTAQTTYGTGPTTGATGPRSRPRGHPLPRGFPNPQNASPTSVWRIARLKCKPRWLPRTGPPTPRTQQTQHNGRVRLNRPPVSGMPRSPVPPCPFVPVWLPVLLHLSSFILPHPGALITNPPHSPSSAPCSLSSNRLHRIDNVVPRSPPRGPDPRQQADPHRDQHADCDRPHRHDELERDIRDPRTDLLVAVRSMES